VLDRNRNDYIDVLEFIEGMTILFSENFEKLVNFIFDFYDFDKDGLISKEDVRVVLSYIPLTIKNSKKYSNMKLKFGKEDYKDRVESQDELYDLLEKSFGKNQQLDYNKFILVVENISSDIFLFILIFLMDKKPFSNTTIKEFKGRKFECRSIKINKTPVLQSRLIASPNLNSKFSPSVTISKSPMMTKRISLDSDKKFGNNNQNESKNFLLKFTGSNNKMEPKTGLKKSGTVNFSNNPNTELINKKFSIKDNSDSNANDINDQNKEEKFFDDDLENVEEDVLIKNIPVNRKKRNDLKNLEEGKNASIKNANLQIYNDLPIIPGLKYKGISSDRIDTIK